MKTEIVAAGSSFARQSPLKKPPPRGEVLKEEEGFKPYVKVVRWFTAFKPFYFLEGRLHCIRSFRDTFICTTSVRW